MPRLTCALLADSASVRENLLHLLGGAISTLYRPTLPAQMGVVLALVVEFHPDELGREQKITIAVRHIESDLEVAEADMRFTTNPLPAGAPAYPVQMPIVMPLQMVPISAHGAHSVQVIINDSLADAVSLPFSVTGAPIPPFGVQPPA